MSQREDEDGRIIVHLRIKPENLQLLLTERVPVVEIHLVGSAEDGVRLEATRITSDRTEEFRAYFDMDWTHPEKEL